MLHATFFRTCRYSLTKSMAHEVPMQALPVDYAVYGCKEPVCVCQSAITLAARHQEWVLSCHHVISRHPHFNKFSSYCHFYYAEVLIGRIMYDSCLSICSSVCSFVYSSVPYILTHKSRTPTIPHFNKSVDNRSVLSRARSVFIYLYRRLPSSFPLIIITFTRFPSGRCMSA